MTPWRHPPRNLVGALSLRPHATLCRTRWAQRRSAGGRAEVGPRRPRGIGIGGWAGGGALHPGHQRCASATCTSCRTVPEARRRGPAREPRLSGRLAGGPRRPTRECPAALRDLRAASRVPRRSHVPQALDAAASRRNRHRAPLGPCGRHRSTHRRAALPRRTTTSADESVRGPPCVAICRVGHRGPTTAGAGQT
jgi:hypothetical protein